MPTLWKTRNATRQPVTRSKGPFVGAILLGSVIGLLSACGGAIAAPPDSVKQVPPPGNLDPEPVPEPFGFWLLVETDPPRLYHETEKTLAREIAAELGVDAVPVEVFVRAVD